MRLSPSTCSYAAGAPGRRVEMLLRTPAYADAVTPRLHKKGRSSSFLAYQQPPARTSWPEDGMLMKRLNNSGRQPQPLPRRRRVISAGTGILLIAIGTVLRFALTVDSPHVLNLHTVGVILILAGVVGLVLPGSRLAADPLDQPRPGPASPPARGIRCGRLRRSPGGGRRPSGLRVRPAILKRPDAPNCMSGHCRERDCVTPADG